MFEKVRYNFIYSAAKWIQIFRWTHCALGMYLAWRNDDYMLLSWRWSWLRNGKTTFLGFICKVRRHVRTAPILSTVIWRAPKWTYFSQFWDWLNICHMLDDLGKTTFLGFIYKVRRHVRRAPILSTVVWRAPKWRYRHSFISVISISSFFDLMWLIILSYFPPLLYY